MSDHIRFQRHAKTLPVSERISLLRDKAQRPELPCALRQPASVLGPTPRRALAALADLGLSDAEIARYHRLPRHCVSELRSIWNIAGEIGSSSDVIYQTRGG